MWVSLPITCATWAAALAACWFLQIPQRLFHQHSTSTHAQSAKPPFGHYCWGMLVSFLAGLQAKLHMQPMPPSFQIQTPSGPRYDELFLFLKQSAIFTSQLCIFLIMFLPTNHKKKPGFPQLIETPSHFWPPILFFPCFLSAISMAS